MASVRSQDKTQLSWSRMMVLEGLPYGLMVGRESRPDWYGDGHLKAVDVLVVMSHDVAIKATPCVASVGQNHKV